MTSKPNFAFDLEDVPADISPVIASLFAGRCMAQVYFHMQQAVLLGSSHDPPQSGQVIKKAGGRHFTLACDAVKAIQLLTYSMLVEDNQKQWLRNDLDRTVLKWTNVCFPEGRLSRVDAANEEFATRQYDSGWEDLCYDVVRALVIPFYEHIRGQLLENLGDVDHRAFELGEAIEQGLCRPDIYRHLHNTGSILILLSEAPPKVDPEEDDGEEVVDSDQNEASGSYDAYSPEVIADRNWAPGELKPGKLWFDELPIVWTRAGLGALELAKFNKLSRKVHGKKSVLQEEVDKTIQELHTTACQKLTILIPDTQPFEMTYRAQVDLKDATVATSQSDSPASAERANPTSIGQSITADVVEVPKLDAKDRKQLLKIKEEIDPDGQYIGSSIAILRMFERINRFNKAPDKPMLLFGPSGAGKNGLPELIHKHSGRNGKFCIEHATAVMNTDFGFVEVRWEGYPPKPGISNADPKGKPGLLEDCRGGTIFVDELHACTEEFQTLLLRVIDEAASSGAVGPLQARKRDVRLILASSKDLEGLEDIILPDLMRRLRTRIVQVPPLRDRKDDIPLFVIKKFGSRKRSNRFLLALLRYDWPGQVGELLDTLINAASTADGDVRLGLLHLEFPDSTIIDDLSKLEDNEAERELYRTLASILKQQGYRKGEGLQKRIAEIVGESQATVSRKVSEHLPEFDLA